MDNDTACAQWYLCKAPDDPMSPNETDKEPCEGAGGLAERFRNVAFAEAARQGWPLGAFESARADLAVHRFADDAAAHEADELTWDTGARPIYQPNATLPLEARRTRVLSGVARGPSGARRGCSEGESRPRRGVPRGYSADTSRGPAADGDVGYSVETESRRRRGRGRGYSVDTSRGAAADGDV